MKNLFFLLIIFSIPIIGNAQCPIYEFEKNIILPTNNNADPINSDACFVNNDKDVSWFCFPTRLINEWQRMGFFSLQPSGGIIADSLYAGTGKEIYLIGKFTILQLIMESSSIYTADNTVISINDLRPIGKENNIYLGKGSTVTLNNQLFEGEDYSPDGISKVHISYCPDHGQLSTDLIGQDNSKTDNRMFDLQGNVISSPQPFVPYIKGNKKFIIVL